MIAGPLLPPQDIWGKAAGYNTNRPSPNLAPDTTCSKALSYYRTKHPTASCSTRKSS